MDDFFPFIWIPKKDEHVFEQISLYIEDVYPEKIEDEKEEEKFVTIIVL